MENPVLEPRAERIARYKAERRRELAERYGTVEDLPVKWTRREGREGHEGNRGMVNSDSAPALGERLHSRTRAVSNGLQSDELSLHRRPGSQDGAEGEGVAGGPHLHTRVSVGQLRSALLQQSGTGAQPDHISCPDGASASLDLAVAPGSDGARRRTRRYLPSGSISASRKNSDRFKTQPITATEREQSSGILDEVEEEDSKGDVKTDDRAKMSVAAKMSLFKELEKSAPAPSLLKPRSGSVSHERRARRSHDHRFMTQPITCEEMGALSSPKPAPVASDPVPSEPEPVEDESCKMSMSEKLALFNKLSLPERMAGGPVDSAPDRRRQKGARYKTQPITVEEVSLLQKGPVQLPALSLAPHLSDRQQALSINLKPSELRLSQPQLGPSSECFSTPPHQLSHLPRTDSEPALRSILKKSRSGGSDWSRTSHNDTPVIPEQNGRDADYLTRRAERQEVREERKEVTSPQQVASVDGASPSRVPWRQRGRGRRETIACTPMRAETDQEMVQSERHSASPVQRNGLDSSVRSREATRGHAPHYDDRIQPKHVTNGSRAKDDSDIAHTDNSDTPQSWGPVFASVFSSSRPQYIMCFNQSNQSFEAQEVASPTQNPAQPQWRKKGSDEESNGAEPELTKAEEQKRGAVSPVEEQRDKTDLQFEACLPKDTAVPEEVRDLSPACEPRPSDGGLHGDQPSPFPCAPPPGDPPATESQDLFCQTSTPILSSAVAEHRRSVRPSRRTQGSRNPLRALAAREDIQQDFMGEAAEERLQAQQKQKNCSSHSQASRCDDVSSASRVPYKNLMLILIKGRRHVQVRLVKPSVTSLNSGDCYLLVTPEHCIVWSGEFASEQEKAKARELAFLVQTQGDLGCGAPQVVHLEEGLNSDGVLGEDFWSLLGGRSHYRGAGAVEEDEQFERGVIESNCVYRLVDDRLVPHEEAWACVPSASLLNPDEALVFDFGSEVYLWQGEGVSQSRGSVALQLAQQVWAGPYDYSNCRVNPLDPSQSDPSVQLRGEGRPSWALFSLVSQNSESSLFREKFVDWMRRDKTAPAPVTKETLPPSSDRLSPCDAKALVSGQRAEETPLVQSVLGGVDVQRGHGVICLDQGRQMELSTVAVDTWLVQEFDDTEVPVESTGQLHQGQSYVIRWTYTINCTDKLNGLDSSFKENTAFFLWRGRESSVTGRDTAAFLSIGTNHQEAAQVVVPQGREPPCFLQLFKGGLVIHKGTREEASSRAGDWRLFVVRGELPEEASLTEVDCCCAGLRSRGSVVLLNSQKGAVYQWTGSKAQASTREVARRTVERLNHMCPPELGLSRGNPLKLQTVEEGSEPADFWAALGHMDRKAYDCMLQDPGKYNFTPRLFHLGASSGSFKAEELQSPSRMPGVVMAMPFAQEMLYSTPQPALFLLDNRLEVYLWQRGQPQPSEQRCAMQTALQYCKEMNPRRPPQAYFISEGTEPLTFTNVFPNWDRSLGPQTQGEVGRVRLTLVQDALAQLMRTHFPQEQLRHSPLPEGVDPQHQEVYLSDQDFQSLLEMKRDECASSKQIDLKKSKGLLS